MEMFGRLNIIISALVVGLFSWQATADEAAKKQPASNIRIDLKNDWESVTPQSEKVIEFARQKEIPVYFALIAEPKSDFSNKFDLKAWSTLVKKNTAKKMKLENREETELKGKEIYGQKVYNYEITGELKGMKLHYRIIMLQFHNYYCKITCWTTPSHWDEAQKSFGDLIKRLQWNEKESKKEKK
jgi:hypothetical protein